MANPLIDSLLAQIAETKEKMDPKLKSNLEIEKLERVVKRLGQFSSDCDECNGFLVLINTHFVEIFTRDESMDKSALNTYKRTLQGAISHLQNKHKLVTDGYYTTLYMSVGIGFGIPVGLLFGNLALGIPIGLCLGVAIGTASDSDAKKKGLII